MGRSRRADGRLEAEQNTLAAGILLAIQRYQSWSGLKHEPLLSWMASHSAGRLTERGPLGDYAW